MPQFCVLGRVRVRCNNRHCAPHRQKGTSLALAYANEGERKISCNEFVPAGATASTLLYNLLSLAYFFALRSLSLPPVSCEIEDIESLKESER